jgi:hypothetical protein
MKLPDSSLHIYRRFTNGGMQKFLGPFESLSASVEELANLRRSFLYPGTEFCLVRETRELVDIPEHASGQIA